jgi:16S rRNA G1207 methylase RsmC
MSEEHYFTARPASSPERRTIAVTLAGRTVSVQTARGVFSNERVDPGTRVLLDEVPEPPDTGPLLDLGCGWGPVALTLALQRPDADVYAVDVNDRALDLVRANAAALGLPRVHAARPQEVPAPLTFSTIWSNPPVRVGKRALHDLLRTWLPRLESGATAYLVVQKNLGSDSLQRWVAHDLGMPCDRYASARGFRVLAVRA